MKISFDTDLFIKSNLKANDFLVLLYLEQEKFNYKNIENTLNITERTIARSIKTLLAFGYIEHAGPRKYQVTDKLAEL